ncbi:MAG: hypothetical protein J5I94_13910, partial [Phaeodactylibacter sp.]|nr:hypothetical protein [Phaeodactylibacter sp.]
KKRRAAFSRHTRSIHLVFWENNMGFSCSWDHISLGSLGSTSRQERQAPRPECREALPSGKEYIKL